MDKESDAWAAWSTRMLTIYPRHCNNYLLHHTESTSLPSTTLSSELLSSHQYKHNSSKKSNNNNKNSKSRKYRVRNESTCENRGKLRSAPFDSHLSRCAAGEFVTLTNVFDRTSSSRFKTAARGIGDDCEVHSDWGNANKRSSFCSYTRICKQHEQQHVSAPCNELFVDDEEKLLQSHTQQETSIEEIEQNSVRARPLSSVLMLRPASSERRLVSSHGWRFVTEQLRLKQGMCHTHPSTREQKFKVKTLLSKEEESTNKDQALITENDESLRELLTNRSENTSINNKLECRSYEEHLTEEVTTMCQPSVECFNKHTEQENVQLLSPQEKQEYLVSENSESNANTRAGCVDCANVQKTEISVTDQVSTTTNVKQLNCNAGEELSESFKNTLTRTADTLSYSEDERKRLLELSSLLREIELRDYFLQHHPLRSMKSRQVRRECTPLETSSSSK